MPLKSTPTDRCRFLPVPFPALWLALGMGVGAVPPVLAQTAPSDAVGQHAAPPSPGRASDSVLFSPERLTDNPAPLVPPGASGPAISSPEGIANPKDPLISSPPVAPPVASGPPVAPAPARPATSAPQPTTGPAANPPARPAAIPEDESRSGLAWICFGLFGLAGLGFLGLWLFRSRPNGHTARWPSVPATVLASIARPAPRPEVATPDDAGTEDEAADRFVPSVHYRYSVDGESFYGDRLRAGEGDAAPIEDVRRVLARYPEGGMLEIRYDPKAPAESTLDVPEPRSPAPLMAAVIALVVALAALAYALI
ncbi:Protein of unknown function [Faunimonas pinastri]|uniref:DUF3592 domain-containing protein n=1 Tax=Faunimonas pinastri TaxID=1855383 RepID=A0A1H9GI35_9HYPH|nr:DUF3592 domain-containing protein [Faunimonas pinastri]SEQ49693.1 Protein of unknown function [Faunimonas pinastri]